ncbi:MAG: hypothetical protein LQ351_003513 [Letrouitia transgressa]|nr:MAG: hypothetical protein LQ351_003513 [Letrouitia transgressa]
MAWHPDQEPLKELVGYLKDALSGHDQNAQKHATIMLGHAKTSPDVTNYLAYILSNGPIFENLGLAPQDVVLVRSSAAINLKNTVKSSYRMVSGSSLTYVKTSALACLQDSNTQIRNFAGSVITELIQKGGILGWPELLPELLSLANNDNNNASAETQEGAMSALFKVCEDNKKILDRDYHGQRPLAVMIPKLLSITSSQIPQVRALALASINSFIPQGSQAITSSIDDLLTRIFQLAHDPSNAVRRNVCRSLVQLVDVSPEKIQPHVGGLVDYIIQQQQNPSDSELALEAAEFWLCVGENEYICPALGPYLGKIVPVLLESMVYEEDDIIRLEGYTDDNAEQEDRAEDVKPHFAKAKGPRLAINGHNDVNGDSAIGSDTFGVSDGDENLSEGEIEESGVYSEGDSEERWNLRKCSAAALDVFASNFHEPVFTVTLPYLKENLRHQDWPRREAAVLAIGAVADGCMDAVTPHLPDLIPYLISLLDDQEAVVRLITCWALGRYSAWASNLENAVEKKKYFEPMMEGILSKMLDKSKRVQESAASAFANLEEKATKKITPYCGPIIYQFVQCFGQYKDRNMFILYDCVQTLAEHVGPALARQDLIDALMPAIIQRWSKVSDGSQEMFPLLECLSYIAAALGHEFAPFAVPIFTRCIGIIHQTLKEYIDAVNNDALDQPNKDFLVTSLDLLSAIIQALRPEQSSQLVITSQPQFFDLLHFCMEDPSNDVRQSSYALLGDCAVNVFGQLEPFLPSLIPTLMQQLDIENLQNDDFDTGFSVINNACWSCGEIAINHKQGMLPYVERLYERLAKIIGNPKVPTSVNENAVIALGRLGVDCSQILAPRLGEFGKPFLQIIEPVEYTDEKAHAFLGFNRIVERNPRAMETCLIEYFQASTAYARCAKFISSTDLFTSFQRVESHRIQILDT